MALWGVDALAKVITSNRNFSCSLSYASGLSVLAIIKVFASQNFGSRQK